jgi:exopolysaccharide biosynthesis protein
MIVEGGRPAPIEPCKTKQPDVRHPRTAVGLDERSETLLLVVVDGRQPRYSQGAEMDELAKILIGSGAFAAMNLDGGGSSTLVARNAEGRVELLNRPIADRVPGRERPIANHLGVYFEP